MDRRVIELAARAANGRKRNVPRGPLPYPPRMERCSDQPSATPSATRMQPNTIDPLVGLGERPSNHALVLPGAGGQGMARPQPAFDRRAREDCDDHTLLRQIAGSALRRWQRWEGWARPVPGAWPIDAVRGPAFPTVPDGTLVVVATFEVPHNNIAIIDAWGVRWLVAAGPANPAVPFDASLRVDSRVVVSLPESNTSAELLATGLRMVQDRELVRTWTVALGGQSITVVAQATGAGADQITGRIKGWMYKADFVAQSIDCDAGQLHQLLQGSPAASDCAGPGQVALDLSGGV